MAPKNKMTDEELSDAFDAINRRYTSRIAMVRAHIAALEAERDEKDGLWGDALKRFEAASKDAIALRERVQALEAELVRVRSVVAEHRTLVHDARRERNDERRRLASIEQCRENEEAKAIPEPSTAEAFATVRDFISDADGHWPSSRALSLLERRMGAMERALRKAHGSRSCVCDPSSPCYVAAALTDAPPGK